MNIKDFGFDKFLRRVLPSDNTPIKTRTTATELSGGILKSAGDIEIGSKLFTMSGEDSNIIVNDGSKDRILIGKRKDGTYGIDVSSVGYSVHEAYEAEMDLTSKATDDWTTFKPANIAYYDGSRVTVSNTPFNKFQVGDRIHLRDSDVNDYYYYVLNIEYWIDGDSNKNRLELYGEQNVPNDTFTVFEVSKLQYPQNFPPYVEKTPTAYNWNGSSWVDISSDFSFMQTRITMVGNLMFIDWDFSTGVSNITSGLGSIYFTLGFRSGIVLYANAGRIYTKFYNATAYKDCLASFSGFTGGGLDETGLKLAFLGNTTTASPFNTGGTLLVVLINDGPAL